MPLFRKKKDQGLKWLKVEVSDRNRVKFSWNKTHGKPDLSVTRYGEAVYIKTHEPNEGQHWQSFQAENAGRYVAKASLDGRTLSDTFVVGPLDIGNTNVDLVHRNGDITLTWPYQQRVTFDIKIYKGYEQRALGRVFKIGLKPCEILRGISDDICEDGIKYIKKTEDGKSFQYHKEGVIPEVPGWIMATVRAVGTEYAKPSSHKYAKLRSKKVTKKIAVWHQELLIHFKIFTVPEQQEGLDDVEPRKSVTIIFFNSSFACEQRCLKDHEEEMAKENIILKRSHNYRVFVGRETKDISMMAIQKYPETSFEFACNGQFTVKIEGFSNDDPVHEAFDEVYPSNEDNHDRRRMGDENNLQIGREGARNPQKHGGTQNQSSSREDNVQSHLARPIVLKNRLDVEPVEVKEVTGPYLSGNATGKRFCTN